MNGDKVSAITYDFKQETYNGISIVRETNTGYINASRMCSDNRKSWRDYKRTKTFKSLLETFKNEVFSKASKGAGITAPSFMLQNGIKPEFQGEYIHPKLVHFVAEWVSFSYAFKVAELMDSINTQVHEDLTKNNLPDTPEHAKPVFEQHVERLIHRDNELEDSQCWGYRGSLNKLDSWERMDLKRDIDTYNQCKSALLKAKEAVESWSSFINEYFPDFHL